MNSLSKTLTLSRAVALAVTMVVGSGLLIIPGIAYSQSGDSAIYAWLICAFATIPLLVVFAVLGSQFPGAGGIAGYMRSVFSDRMGNATEVLLLAALPGGAALALTGGSYVSKLLSGTDNLIFLCTLSIILIGALVNLMGARLSGRLQQGLAALILLTLAAVALLTLTFGNHGLGKGIASPTQMFESLPSVGLVFFTFVGWEMMSFTSEEFENPKRDFPRMIFLSFIIVISLYLLIAVALQLTLPQNDPEVVSSPIAAMISTIVGPVGGHLILAIGSTIAITNYISIVWAFSRFTYASAREGLLPVWFSRLSPNGGIPQRAVLAVSTLFGALTILNLLQIAQLSHLFELAGITFFFSYCLCIGAWIKYTPHRILKAVGVLMLCGEMVLYLTFGLKALYPLLFWAVGYWIGKPKEQEHESL